MFSREFILVGIPKFSWKTMGAIVLHSHSVLQFAPFSSFTKQPKLGKPIFFLRDVPSSFERKDFRLTISCIGSDGSTRGRPPRKSSSSGSKTKRTKNPNSANQEEIIALFRKIQSSISKEDSLNAKKTSADASEEKSSAESILRVLGGSRKQGKSTKKVAGRRGVPKKEQGSQGHPAVTEFRTTRPPSKFVKRSPIPSLTTPRGEFVEVKDEDEPKVEELKLPQLKELAKSRGIKGYSKLKKSELVSLLMS